MLVLRYFFFLGMGYGLHMRWAGVANSLGSSSGEEDFDVLGPMSWPVEPCSHKSARASSLPKARSWCFGV